MKRMGIYVGKIVPNIYLGFRHIVDCEIDYLESEFILRTFCILCMDMEDMVVWSDGIVIPDANPCKLRISRDFDYYDFYRRRRIRFRWLAKPYREYGVKEWTETKSLAHNKSMPIEDTVEKSNLFFPASRFTFHMCIHSWTSTREAFRWRKRRWIHLQIRHLQEEEVSVLNVNDVRWSFSWKMCKENDWTCISHTSKSTYSAMRQ